MTPVEIMALIFLVAASVKLVIILVNPSSWFGFTKKIWSNPILMALISFALALVTLYYLINDSINIVQIFAVMLFVSLLAAVGVSIYVKDVEKLADKLMKDKSIIKKSWLYILIWIVLILWGFKELFF